MAWFTVRVKILVEDVWMRKGPQGKGEAIGRLLPNLLVYWLEQLALFSQSKDCIETSISSAFSYLVFLYLFSGNNS